MFSDPVIKKRAAERDVNYSNSYRRFYEEWYTTPVRQYQRKVQTEYIHMERTKREQEQHQRQQQKRSNSSQQQHTTTTAAFSANFFDQDYQRDCAAADNVREVQRKVVVFLTGDVLLLLMIITMVTLKVMSQKRQDLTMSNVDRQDEQQHSGTTQIIE